MAKLNCIIITPERKIRNVECDYVGAAGVEGDFGILPQHAPFVSELVPGVLFIRNVGRKDDPVGIESGFLHVLNDKVTVVADNAYEREELDKTDAEYKKLYEDAKADVEKMEKSDPKYADKWRSFSKRTTQWKLISYK